MILMLCNMGRSDLPDMYARAREHAAPEGESGHIRQITTAHVTYVTRFAKRGLIRAQLHAGLTFHHHSTDTTIDQQFMLVPLPNLQRSAFTEASFTGLSGIHGCSGGLLMASTCPARQTGGRESPQGWLVRLGIDVATF